MDISMDIIAERLNKYNFVQYSGKKSEPVLESTRLLHRYLDKFDPKYLYIGVPEDIERLPMQSDMKYVTVICCGIPKSYDRVQSECNFYYIDGDVDFGLFYNEVEDVFTFYNCWENKLKSICFSLGSLQQMIDVSDEIFPYPLALVDGAERTIAFSRHKECDDSVWKYIQEGYIKTEYLLRDNIHSKDILHYRSPKQLFTTASNRYVMLQPVIVQYHTVAFVSMIMNEAGERAFSRGMEQLITVLTREITNRMEADEFYGASMGRAAEFFLADLIGKKDMNRESIVDRANFLEQEIYAKRRILCICPGTEGEIIPKKNTVLREVKRMLPNCDSCFYEGNIVIIQEWEKKKERTGWLEQMEEWLRKNELLCGVSMVFSSLFEAAVSYSQAKAAVRLGRSISPDKRCCLYSGYIMEHSFEIIENQLELRSMLHPIVRQIIESYGEEHYMLHTVGVYLICERNISVAAKALHIHRNTLLYRLEHLNDRLQCDFSDQTERLEIIYSIKIVEYLHEVKKENILN